MAESTNGCASGSGRESESGRTGEHGMGEGGEWVAGADAGQGDQKRKGGAEKEEQARHEDH